MTADIAALLGEHLQVDVEELARATGLSGAEVIELTEYGVFEPLSGGTGHWCYAARCIAVGRRASRLRTDFGLDLHGLALVSALLERIDDLEDECARLRAQSLE
ncbi:MAG: hypothetical protein IT532_15195 [Burkholderiales bacterium]|nr:hypothetical protein [Burkholderiales bacterium]